MLQLLQNLPDKIESLLLNLNLKLHNSRGLEDKLRYCHLYFIVLNLCVESLEHVLTMQHFLTRQLIYPILHSIKNHRNQPELSRISCIFFQNILKKLVVTIPRVLKTFFLVIVSRLKTIAVENSHVSSLCIDMLRFLIVDKADVFIEEIEQLDCCPVREEFKDIYARHVSIKYDGKNVTLEDEIALFLDFWRSAMESLDECEHGLKHIRELLCKRKGEVGELYKKIRRTRGFSEDCDKTSLHKLICTLIRLSSSTNENV